MEYITEDHLKLLLNKEWLVKNDSDRSVPYLFKFHASVPQQGCCVIITDTKHVWGEVLSSKHLSRRWKDCNPQASSPLSEDAEEEWRAQILDLVSAAHTLGGLTDLSFDVGESTNADLAIELGNDDFKWRWETYSLGPKVSADVLSQHLIMPLISVAHLAFSSSDPVSELSCSDLELAVDKVARTARRGVDTHVKHAMTRPRVATSLSRISAIVNCIPDHPAVLADASTPEFKLPSVSQRAAASETRPAATVDRSRATQDGNSAALSHTDLPVTAAPRMQKSPTVPPPQQRDDDDSATEPDTEDEEEAPQRSARVESKSPPPAAPASGSANRLRQTSPKAPLKKAAPTTVEESSDSSPARPSKKAKRAESSTDDDSDSEAERRRRLAVHRNASSSRGSKQPIRRGARRF